MSFHKEAGGSGWLSSLSDKRSRIAGLLGEIASLGAPAAMKPGIFKKFLDLLAQVACVKEKENELIERIEAMEEQHRYCRAHMQLEHADPEYALKFMEEEENRNEMTRRRKGLWRYLHMYFNPETQEIVHKEQALNND